MAIRSLTWMLAPEGASDVDFLLPLLRRLLVDACHGSRSEMDIPDGIDLRGVSGYSRSPQRVAQLVSRERGQWLLVVHADGGSDPGLERQIHIEPILACVPSGCAGLGVTPVREMEAWALADAATLARVFRTTPDALFQRGLPRRTRELERLADPKALLDHLARSSASRSTRSPGRIPFGRLGEQASLDELRKLSAFGSLEADLASALRTLGVTRP